MATARNAASAGSSAPRGVHGARVVYRENPAFLAQLRTFAASQGLTLSEVQRQATRRMVAGA